MRRRTQALIVALNMLIGGTAAYKVSPYLPRVEFVEKYVLPGYNPQNFYGKIANGVVAGLVSGGLALLVTEGFISPVVHEIKRTKEEEELRLLGLDDK